VRSKATQSYVYENSEVNGLERALTTFLGPCKLAGVLARVLIQARKTARVSYEEVEEVAKDDSEDVLLLGFQLRLLVPTRSARGALEWGDAVLLPKPGEMFKMPNVVNCLVEEAIRTGRWDPDNAVAKVFMIMGVSEWEEMPKLVQKLGEEAKNCKVNAIQIKRVCGELDLEDKVDLLIAELKGSGVLSPRLGSLNEVIREGSPLYELNPSLFVNTRGK
jgi:hypothetical protein